MLALALILYRQHFGDAVVHFEIEVLFFFAADVDTAGAGGDRVLGASCGCGGISL